MRFEAGDAGQVTVFDARVGVEQRAFRRQFHQAQLDPGAAEGFAGDDIEKTALIGCGEGSSLVSLSTSTGVSLAQAAPANSSKPLAIVIKN